MITNHSIRYSKVLLVAVVLLGSQTARANSYSFSFTTADALNALATTDSLFLLEGYFALFLQPYDAQIPINTYSYAYGPMHNPKEDGPDRWQSTTIMDPSHPADYGGNPGNLGPGTWVQFSKLGEQTEVTLASRANGRPDGSNIFLSSSHHYSDDGTPPFDFGGTSATITSLMREDGVFRFVLSLDRVLTTPVTFHGFASGVGSFFDNTFDSGGKTDFRMPFSLTLTPTYTSVPEPDTVGSASAGIFLITLGSLRLLRRGGRKSHVFSDPGTASAKDVRDC